MAHRILNSLCNLRNISASNVTVWLRSQMVAMCIVLSPSHPLMKIYCFVWRNYSSDPLQRFSHDSRHVWCLVSLSLLLIRVKQNTRYYASSFLPCSVNSFYLDNGFTVADSINEVIKLKHSLVKLSLHKWNSSEPMVVEHFDPKLRDQQSVITISEYMNTPRPGGRMEFLPNHFLLIIARYPWSIDIAYLKVFDALGDCSGNIQGKYYPSLIIGGKY